MNAAFLVLSLILANIFLIGSKEEDKDTVVTSMGIVKLNTQINSSICITEDE